MTNDEIDKELKQLEKDYWDALQAYLNADALVYPAVPETRGETVKKLTDEYYARKLVLEAMRTGGASDEF